MGLLVFGISFLFLFSVSSVAAQIELTTLSENIIDSDAGVDSSGPRDLNIEVGRDVNGTPVIVYTKDKDVRIFWCDNMNCSSGNNELVLENTIEDTNFEISSVSFDVNGGPNFIVSVDDWSGYWTYVQCSNTTCANATDWVSGSVPDAPMMWAQNAQRPQQTELILKPEDGSAPIIWAERINKGVDYFDCDDGQNCDPVGVKWGQRDEQSFILDVKRSSSVANVTEMISRSRDGTDDFMFTTFECDASKSCTRTTDATLDVNQYDDLFNGTLGYEWELPSVNGGIKDGEFDNDGNPALTLQYSTGIISNVSADMFALLRCTDALCSNRSVTMIDAMEDLRTGYMDPHVAFRSTSGLPVMAYQLCGENEPAVNGSGCDLKIMACDSANCDGDNDAVILSEDIFGHVVIDVEDEGMLTFAYRNAAGELVFGRVGVTD